MVKDIHVPLFNLVMCVSGAIDLVSPALVGHHKRVAYIAKSIAREAGISSEEQNNVVLAGLLHDSGALSVKERLDALEFETNNAQSHAHTGYLLLSKFAPFQEAALLVKYHHTPWAQGTLQEEVPLGSQIIHLADRIEVLINRKREILGQVKDICAQIQKQSGHLFSPDLVEVFMGLAKKEYFWFEALSPALETTLQNRVGMGTLELDDDGLLSFAKMLSQIVDFRSSFTASHSSGVAASAEALARYVGFSERECKMMMVAGYVHDLGKLAVPAQILEKPGRLDDREIDIMRSHAFYTHYVFEPLPDLDMIRTWAAFHHERLDGTGYPFHHCSANISLGSRVMAVADVFTALTEDRPYRAGLTREEVMSILRKMVGEQALDRQVVATLEAHYDEIYMVRIEAQKAADAEYRAFKEKA